MLRAVLPSRLRVASLHLYPIKSAAGHEVRELPFDERGPAGDRRLMLVTTQGRFITQRTHPRLALLRARLDGDALVVATPAGEAVTQALPRGGPLLPVKIFRDTIDVLPVPGPASLLCSDFLGTVCTLVAVDPRTVRTATSGDGRTFPISLVDAWPLLVTTRASLAAISAHAGRELPLERFRPNIVLEPVDSAQVPAHVEDRAARLHAAGIELVFGKTCSRCTIVDVDPRSGEVDEGPLEALQDLRGEAKFGAYYGARCSRPLRTGEVLEVEWRVAAP